MNKKRRVSISRAASIMGRKGGRTTGPSKARRGTSVYIKSWWASPESLPYRAKARTTYTVSPDILENPGAATT